MNILLPYSSEKINFQLAADLQVSNSTLHLTYTLTDQENLFEKPRNSLSWAADQINFISGLWNQTCFEAFLKPIGMDRYYEFNFSLNPAWMVFQFENYRIPQPPVSSGDFQIQSMSWDHLQNKLSIVIKNNTSFKNFNVGLTAVLEEKTGFKHYCALVHTGLKADFHLAESFTLLRG